MEIWEIMQQKSDQDMYDTLEIVHEMYESGNTLLGNVD